ncbi:hypothetical protein TVAG_309280 [Trichomonas vaginalis G3]|uniref:Uncharacterized protein n=1 Tax=Trichomonas vaginalis (strain ATCC PRA-98 / G3) TaxID=412133 RepID=A2EDS4_TRIV3|nr:hypothetical protein TVAG_309280 [Trichomonas vaginalis G3]|eukprot:XP_001321462.1 hypothetical protein [Trichomonas vaginalis G3]
MYAQKPRAIKQFAERIHALQTRYSPDDVVSLQIFVQTVQEESPDDLIALKSQNIKLVWLSWVTAALAFPLYQI